MRRPALLQLAATLLSVGCSQGDPVADGSTRAPYGGACKQDADCASGICVDNVCSKLCRRLADCPALDGLPYDCGEITEKKNMIACYPRRAPTVPYTVGHNCSLDLKCAVGFRCMGPEGTADRYCSKICNTDRDCPPRYRCAQARIGKLPAEPDKWCRRRDFCHPCVIDDQCGTPPENLCVRDDLGHGFCSRACTPTGSSCPSWAKCENIGDKQLQCRPKRGTCFNPDGGGLCDNCTTFGWTSLPDGDFTINEMGTCGGDGVCYLLSKAGTENICVTPCAADGSCPPATGSITYTCFTLKSLGGEYCLPSPDGIVFGTCAP